MKLLVLISLVTVCYSFPTYFTRRWSFDIDGTITIQGENGRQVTVHKSRQDLSKYDVILSYPYGMFKKHVVLQVDADEINNIVQVFAKYESLMEEETYKRLSEEVHTLYRDGVLHPKAYSVLQLLDHHLFAEHVDQEVLSDDDSGSTEYNRHQEDEEERAKTPVERMKWLQRKVEEYQLHQDESLHRILLTYLPEHYLAGRSLDSFKHVLADMVRVLEVYEFPSLSHEHIRYFVKRCFEQNHLTNEENNKLVQALHQLQFEQYPWARQHMQHNHENQHANSSENPREATKGEQNREHSHQQQEQHEATRDKQHEYEDTHHPGHITNYRQSTVPRENQYWRDSNKFTDVVGHHQYLNY